MGGAGGFWKNKRVLVTGGAGFIGSHLVEALLARGAQPRVPVREGTRLDFLDACRGSVEFVQADLQRPEDCQSALRQQAIVMHLAGNVAGLEYNIQHPGSIYRDNMIPFLNVIEAARKEGVERFLVTSSACVYPRFCSIPTPEREGFRDRPEPTNEGYGWAKRMQEFVGQAYSREYGMTVAIARPYNAYGPRDNFDPGSSHVIPALLHRILTEDGPLRVWGAGDHSRSFLYVSDFVEGLLAVTEHYAVADPVNLGAEEEVSIRELVFLLLELAGKKEKKVMFDTSQPTGQPRRKCDSTKAQETIHFRARVGLREGLQKTIAWYQERLRAGR